jgi:hypothetical protein
VKHAPKPVLFSDFAAKEQAPQASANTRFVLVFHDGRVHKRVRAETKFNPKRVAVAFAREKRADVERGRDRELVSLPFFFFFFFSSD